MKFGLFFEHEVPRPWHDGDEKRKFDEAIEQIELADRLGFDCAWLVEHHFLEEYSHSSAPDLFLAAVSQRTERIRLGPGVSNSITRDAAVTASAALALQVESGGRAVLGIGRGDSSVQRIGKREDPVASFERYLTAVQAYLAGEAVDRDGFASRLEWYEHAKVAKVPVEVAATGRKVIEVAARRADAVCLAAGADPEYLGSVLAHARDAARAAGRTLRYGAFVNAVIHDDVAVARDAVRGSAASFARFSAFRGSDLARLPAPLAAAARWLREHYDMRQHTRTGVPHTAPGRRRARALRASRRARARLLLRDPRLRGHAT